MNINNYISSGILENYVLGLVSDTERHEVEKLAAEHPAIRTHLNSIEDALKAYIQSNSMPLPAGLKAAALARIDSEIADNKSPKPSNPGGSSNKLTGGLLGLLMFALAGLGLYLFSQNNTINEELVEAQNQFKVLKTDCDTQAAKLIDLENKLAILRDTSNQTVHMKSAGNGLAPQAIAAVYNNASNKKTYLDVINLPDAPSGKQYQLWALVEGTPVDMGVFDLHGADSSFLEVPFVEGAGAYAVTLEDAGGKPTPDLTQLYVIGNT